MRAIMVAFVAVAVSLFIAIQLDNYIVKKYRDEALDLRYQLARAKNSVDECRAHLIDTVDEANRLKEKILSLRSY